MKNASVIFLGKNHVELVERELPSLKPGELLVKTIHTMISIGTEMTILTREGLEKDCVWTSYGAYPFYPGYNNIGEIVDASDEKDRHLIGTKVFSYLPHAQYGVLTAEDEYRVLPEKIEAESVIFTSFAEIVLQGIRRGRSTWGENAVVYGAGLLGQLTADFLRIAGSAQVVVCDTSDARLSLLPKTSIITAVNPQKESVEEVVRRVTKGRMADVVYELTGVGSLIPKEMELLHDQGRIVILSSPRGETTMDFHDLVNRTSTEIIGAHNMSHTPVATLNNPWSKARDDELFMDMIMKGQVNMKRLISHREPYTKAVELYHMLMKDRSEAMGVLMDWQ